MGRAEEIEKRLREIQIEKRLAAIQIEKKQPSSPSTSTAEALASGAATGATLGFADELMAGGKAAYQDVKGVLTGQPTESTYDENLEQVRQRQDLLKQEHPTASMVGDIAGGVINPVGRIPGVAGAVRGFGEGTGGFSERLGGAAEGAAGDLILGKAGQMAGKAIKGVGEGIKGAGKAAMGSVEDSIYNATTNMSTSKDVPIKELLKKYKDKFIKHRDLDADKAFKITQDSIQEELDSLKNMNKDLNLNNISMFESIEPKFNEIIEEFGYTKMPSSWQRKINVVNEAIKDKDYSKIIDIRSELKTIASKPGMSDKKEVFKEFSEHLDQVNLEFLDTAKKSTEFKKRMETLSDLYELDKHFKRSTQTSRPAFQIGLQDTFTGGLAGAAAGSVLGGPVGAMAGTASVAASGLARGSTKFNMMMAQLKNNPVPKNIDSMVNLFKQLGDELPEVIKDLPPDIQNSIVRASQGFELREDIEDAIVSAMDVTMPEIFQSTKYASELNGKLLGENDRQVFKREVLNRKDLGATQKAKMLSEMNKTNRIVENPSSSNLIKRKRIGETND